MKDKELSEKALSRIHWIIGFIIFCIVLATWGCATKTITITEYKEVKIPIKCQIDMPQKPEPVKNPVEMNLLILKYTEELESVLRGCK